MKNLIRVTSQDSGQNFRTQGTMQNCKKKTSKSHKTILKSYWKLYENNIRGNISVIGVNLRNKATCNIAKKSCQKRIKTILKSYWNYMKNIFGATSQESGQILRKKATCKIVSKNVKKTSWNHIGNRLKHLLGNISGLGAKFQNPGQHAKSHWDHIKIILQPYQNKNIWKPTVKLVSVP